MEGYIALHRKIEENEFYFSEKFTKSQAWIDLLLLATHSNHTAFIRGFEIKLKPGELCRSQLTLAKRWKWNFKTVKKFLNLLEKREMVETKTDNITTVIFIKNWKHYQLLRNEVAKKTKTNGEQNGEQKESRMETINNVNNVNTIITDSMKRKSCLYVLVSIYVRLVRGVNVNPETADYSYIGKILKIKEMDDISFHIKCLMLCHVIKKNISNVGKEDFKGYLFNDYKNLTTFDFRKIFSNNKQFRTVSFKTGIENSYF